MVRIAFAVLLASATASAEAGAPPPQQQAAPAQPAPLVQQPAKKLVRITDKSIEVGEPIYFAVGTAEILDSSHKQLDALAAALLADKKITLVEIGVHTDARGTSEFNRAISQKRAEAVMKYLVDHGVDAKRLRPIGYGETRPLDKHSNPAAWAKNRRTEFVILQRAT